MSEQISSNDRVKMVRGRLRESMRLAKRSRSVQKPKVIAYFRYVFTDTKRFIGQKDTYDALQTVKSSGGDGVVLWGSSFDLNTKYIFNCDTLYKYMQI